MARKSNDFQTIRSEGGLLPPDLLRRILDIKEKLPGTLPEDYGLPQGERFNEVITQSWNRLRKHWAEFRSEAAKLAEGEAGTGLTNEKWNLPLLRELGFGPLPTSASPEIDGRTYAINRFLGSVPIHLIGCGLSLDRRAAGVRGAAAANPHGLIQEFLNRNNNSLWGIVANGLRFRILRDNQALSRQSFVEFDLVSMFDGEVYSDFVLFWLVAHSTRFTPREAGRVDTCSLEQWTKLANEQGTRALGDLRGGVERALQILGEGFTSHPKNARLRETLRTGQIPMADFHGQLLRVVYRLIFLFVAEDRTIDGKSLLHPLEDSESARCARARYETHYSTARLRELASRIKGSRHGDLWRQFQILVGALSGDDKFAAARELLALPALGSFLWDPASTAALNDAELTNFDFLEALRHLAFTRQGKVLRPVDYKNLGAEELGGVYESLLALTPQLSADGARFTFAEFAGNVRKTSGSYYTPDSLVQCLLDSALDPLVEEAIKGKSGVEAEKAILSLKVCDPAVGSGHFLVGAAHRLARHLSRVRALAQGESEPSPLLYQQALRDVIGRCLYGVDINPMAAELCRVSLWLEALEPGKPLSFLDHHIRVGNSLLGTTPELIAAGLPDEAFQPIEGDDKKVCTALKKRNKQERDGGQRDMLHLMEAEPVEQYNSIEASIRSIDEAPDNTIAEIQRKAEQFHRLIVSPEYRHAQQVADAWCAAFVWKKQASLPFEPITTDTIRRLEDDPKTLTGAQSEEVERLSRQYQFFHWHLAFPEVFAQGGFDCVLGNPPWEQFEFDPAQFFAASAPDILYASHMAERDLRIEKVLTAPGNESLRCLYLTALRENAEKQLLLHGSGRFLLSSIGRLNTAPLFIELSSGLVNRLRGNVGLVVPTTFAVGSFSQELFRDFMNTSRLHSFYAFDNSAGIFPDVKSSFRFGLLTLRPATADGVTRPADFVFFAERLADLATPERHIMASTSDMFALNPNTGTCAVFRWSRDAAATFGIYRRVPVLALEQQATLDPWSFDSLLMFMSNNLSRHYIDATKDVLPVHEAKLCSPYDHRRATKSTHGLRILSDEEKENPNVTVVPRYWVPASLVEERLNSRWSRRWLLVWQDVTDVNTMSRTVQAMFLPLGACGDGLPVLMVGVATADQVCLLANLNAFILDFVARQKVGGTHLRLHTFKQLPVHSPATYASRACWLEDGYLRDWIVSRVLELTYTAWDLEPFAQDCGWSGPPFRWNEERRFLLRCELDAAFFHLYLPSTSDGQWKPARIAEGAVRDETPEELAELKRHFPTPRDAVSYIMDTFPIVKRKDEEKWGEYRAKRVILEIYDAMAEAMRTGKPYQTRLDPPPADPRCCHPARETK